MNPSATSIMYAALVGIAFALGLELLVQGLWLPFYSHYPLPGYAGAMAAGQVEPALYNSAMSLRHAVVAFFVAGLVLMAPGGGRVPAALVFAGAAFFTLNVLTFAHPEVRHSNLGPLTPVFLGIYFGPPFLVGMGVGGAVGWWRQRHLPRQE